MSAQKRGKVRGIFFEARSWGVSELRHEKLRRRQRRGTQNASTPLLIYAVLVMVFLASVLDSPDALADAPWWNWCRCLGIHCQIDAHARPEVSTSAIATLNAALSMEPQGLHPDLQRAWKTCADPKTPYPRKVVAIATARRLTGGLNTLVLIPSSLRRRARMGPQGARFVQDCVRGGHLHVAQSVPRTWVMRSVALLNQIHLVNSWAQMRQQISGTGTPSVWEMDSLGRLRERELIGFPRDYVSSRCLLRSEEAARTTSFSPPTISRNARASAFDRLYPPELALQDPTLLSLWNRMLAELSASYGSSCSTNPLGNGRDCQNAVHIINSTAVLVDDFFRRSANSPRAARAQAAWEMWRAIAEYNSDEYVARTTNQREPQQALRELLDLCGDESSRVCQAQESVPGSTEVILSPRDQLLRDGELAAGTLREEMDDAWLRLTNSEDTGSDPVIFDGGTNR